MTDTVELCGIARPDGAKFCNWPRVCCLLPLGHESDHEFSRSDGVTFVWPVTREDVDRLGERRRR